MDVRYEMEDITVGANHYIPLFYVSITFGVIGSLITFITCFGLGLYVGKKAKSRVDIKVVATDE